MSLKKKKQNRAKRQRTSAIAKTYAKELVAKATKAEIAFMRFLDEFSFNYKFQRPFKHKGRFVIVDFYLPDHKIVIEIDGEYHNDPAQIMSDRDRTNTLIKANHIRQVVRFTNNEVLNGTKRELLQKVVVGCVPQSSLLLGDKSNL